MQTSPSGATLSVSFIEVINMIRELISLLIGPVSVPTQSRGRSRINVKSGKPHERPKRRQSSVSRYSGATHRSKSTGSSRASPSRSRVASANRNEGTVTVYHGTPNLENARSIVRQGWVVGTGNAYGDGVYATTDRKVAASYAGAAGYIVKANLYPGKVAVWNSRLDGEFRKWCAANSCSADMSARTAFLLSKGFRTLRDGAVYIVLLRGYRNPAATKIRLKRLRVQHVERAADGKTVRV